MKIKAAVLEQFGSPLEVQELDLDEPRDGEVLVRVAACGVCHTDLYTASGADPSGYAPTVLGHEGAGVVERTGAGVTSLAPGDHVVTLFSPQCRECVHCLPTCDRGRVMPGWLDRDSNGDSEIPKRYKRASLLPDRTRRRTLR